MKIATWVAIFQIKKISHSSEIFLMVGDIGLEPMTPCL